MVSADDLPQMPTAMIIDTRNSNPVSSNEELFQLC